ncbi:MAG: hypothetical protein KJP00_00995 [Bacteroidia bacterium]|nr:hypothetical protein [Bacteroidia bacterium]
MALNNPSEELQPSEQPEVQNMDDQMEEMTQQNEKPTKKSTASGETQEELSGDVKAIQEKLLTINDKVNTIKSKQSKKKKRELKQAKKALKMLEELEKLKSKKLKLKEQERELEGEFLSKNAVNILRTVLRNNIDLTNIADNKANVLLSLNALMLTFLVPLTVPYFDRIKALGLGIPLIFMALTCLVTIYIAVHVLKPGKLSSQKVDFKTAKVSPFFFGSAKNMTQNEFLEYSERVLSDQRLSESFISNDFYHISVRLAEKMKMVRNAFNIFIYGMSFTIIIIIIMLILN